MDSNASGTFLFQFWFCVFREEAEGVGGGGKVLVIRAIDSNPKCVGLNLSTILFLVREVWVEK